MPSHAEHDYTWRNNEYLFGVNDFHFFPRESCTCARVIRRYTRRPMQPKENYDKYLKTKNQHDEAQSDYFPFRT